MYDNRKQSTVHGLAIMLELVRKELLQIKDHVELDVAFHLGGPGFATKAVVGRTQLAHFGAIGTSHGGDGGHAIAVAKSLQV